MAMLIIRSLYAPLSEAKGYPSQLLDFEALDDVLAEHGGRIAWDNGTNAPLCLEGFTRGTGKPLDGHHIGVICRTPGNRPAIEETLGRFGLFIPVSPLAEPQHHETSIGDNHLTLREIPERPAHGRYPAHTVLMGPPSPYTTRAPA